LFAQLVSDIFSSFGPDPPVLQTDGQPDNVRLGDRTLRYSASRGKMK